MRKTGRSAVPSRGHTCMMRFNSCCGLTVTSSSCTAMLLVIYDSVLTLLFSFSLMLAKFFPSIWSISCRPTYSTIWQLIWSLCDSNGKVKPACRHSHPTINCRWVSNPWMNISRWAWSEACWAGLNSRCSEDTLCWFIVSAWLPAYFPSAVAQW